MFKYFRIVYGCVLYHLNVASIVLAIQPRVALGGSKVEKLDCNTQKVVRLS